MHGHHYIEEYVCSPKLSREYINKGHPNLKLVIPIEQDKKVREHIFWKKYGVKYYSYYPLKENGKMDCYLNTPNRLLTAYNREVFRYLDKNTGKHGARKYLPASSDWINHWMSYGMKAGLSRH